MNFNDNKDFYPTPNKLIRIMISKIDKFSECINILEPSAGSGDIIDYINEHERYGRRKRITAIEIDPNLRSILKDKKIPVVDNDFLNYNGAEQFDLIIANFPFSQGEHHLLKAIQILFSGQIVCLLNAETIRNPYSNTRKELNAKLEEVGAKVEFIEQGFTNPETKRKTEVECALIYIDKRIQIEDTLYRSMEDSKNEDNIEFSQKYEISNGNGVKEIVAAYNERKEAVVKTILDFYSNYHLFSGYLSLEVNTHEKDSLEGNEGLTSVVKARVNQFIIEHKRRYWLKVLELKEVKRYLTSQKRDLFKSNIEYYCQKEFTEENIKQFIINLIQDLPNYINESIEALFDKITSYALRGEEWGENEYKKSIHLFNGWKTNNAFMVNEKYIMPFYKGYSFNSDIQIDYREEDVLDDLDVVISYFCDKKTERSSYYQIKEALDNGQSRKIDTNFFEINVYKKGTMHFKFKDPQVWRRFNIEACKLKGFLPFDYASRPWDFLNDEEKDLVNRFEGESKYEVVESELGILGAIKGNCQKLIA